MARMRRLVCAYVISKPPKTGFLAARTIYCVLLYCGKFNSWPASVIIIPTALIL